MLWARVNIVVLGVVALQIIAMRVPSLAQSMPGDYSEALSYLGRQGDYKDNVLKINIPRNDLKVTVDGIQTPTPFGFGGWVSMTKGDGGPDVMMGDLVLLQEEVNPIISALQDNGLKVTALHNHFFWDNPRLFFMHIHGRGKAVDLAHKVKPALDLIGKVPPRRGSEQPAVVGTALTPGSLDTSRLEQIIGHKGERTGPVFKITIGRDDIGLKDMGATINARMGLNTWIAFFGSDQNAVVAGDVAMLESEVNPTVTALRRSGIEIVAIHNHMIGSRPVVIFLHYWGKGPADKLATGFKAALDELGK